MNKTILLATFILPENLEIFLKYLLDDFKITKNKVFCYKNLIDDKLIITFKLDVGNDEKINLKKIFPSSIPIHKKGDALYTINALNKLIDSIETTKIGVDYKTIKIDWTNYQNKFIITNSNELCILNINRVF